MGPSAQSWTVREPMVTSTSRRTDRSLAVHGGPWCCQVSDHTWSTRSAGAHGHEWAPGLITVSWMPCDCPPAAAAREHGPGHMVVYCEAAPGCRSAWYQPR